jgi:transposase
VLEGRGFDELAERQCFRLYADKTWRPSPWPGRYFCLLLIGYFEGIDSERGIAWREADSLGLRGFLVVVRTRGRRITRRFRARGG